MLLSKLGLSAYAGIFEEEELTDLSLLRSMRPDLLRDALIDLGLEEEHALQLYEAVMAVEPCRPAFLTNQARNVPGGPSKRVGSVRSTHSEACEQLVSEGRC